MAKIYNSEIIKELVDGCKLQINTDKVPNELAEKVVPVFLANTNKPPTVRYIRDDTLNVQKKTFTVPAGKMWRVRMIHGQYATSTTAGNRIPRLTVKDDDGTTFFFIDASATIPASNTENVHCIINYTAGQSEVDAGTFLINLPDIYMQEGWTIDMMEAGGVDIGVDDLKVAILYDEYDNPPDVGQ